MTVRRRRKIRKKSVAVAAVESTAKKKKRPAALATATVAVKEAAASPAKKKKQPAALATVPAAVKQAAASPVKKKKKRPAALAATPVAVAEDRKQRESRDSGREAGKKREEIAGAVGGREYASLADLLEAVPDDYAHLRERTIPPELLKAQGLGRGDYHPLSPNRLFSLLVTTIGHRQTIYCNLEELRDKRGRMRMEKSSTRHQTIQVMLEHFNAVVDTERKLTKLAMAWWPTMALPHGAGSADAPAGLFVGGDDAPPPAGGRPKKKKKKRRATN